MKSFRARRSTRAFPTARQRGRSRGEGCCAGVRGRVPPRAAAEGSEPLPVSGVGGARARGSAAPRPRAHRHRPRRARAGRQSGGLRHLRGRWHFGRGVARVCVYRIVSMEGIERTDARTARPRRASARRSARRTRVAHRGATTECALHSVHRLDKVTARRPVLRVQGRGRPPRRAVPFYGLTRYVALRSATTVEEDGHRGSEMTRLHGDAQRLAGPRKQTAPRAPVRDVDGVGGTKV